MARRKDEPAKDLVDDWINDFMPNTRMAAEGTLDAYWTAIEMYHAYLRATGGPSHDPKLRSRGLLAARMSNFDAAHLTGFVDWLRSDRGNCSKTVELRLAAIRSFLEYATLRNLVYSPLLVQAQRIKFGRKDPEKLVGHMSEEAWRAVMAQPRLAKRTEWRNWVFMIVMYEIAGRNQEVINLRPRDLVLEGDNPRVYVWGKGRKEGVTPIRRSVAEILSDYLAKFHPGREKSDDPLFYIMRKGEKCFMSPDCSEAFLKRYGEAARASCPCVPERVHPHLVRHTRAQHLKDSGMSDEELAKFLRHSGLETVKVYAKASVESKRRSLAMANGKDPDAPQRRGSWEGDEDMIRRLRNPRSR